MTAQHFTGRSGGSQESPDRASLGDEALIYLIYVIWSLLPLVLLVSTAAVARTYLPREPALAMLVLLVVVCVATVRRQWWWFRGVQLRRRLPMKFRQAGIINHQAQTRRVRRVKWRGSHVTIHCAATDGHPGALFDRHFDALKAVFGAEDVGIGGTPHKVRLTVIRRSVHNEVQVQSWH